MENKENYEIIKTEKQKVTDKQLKDAFEETGGNVVLSAKRLGVTAQGIYRRLHKSASLRLALEESRENQLDEADFQLQQAVKLGAPWAIQFTLRTLGRKRGYSEALTVTQEGGRSEKNLPNFKEWSFEDKNRAEELLTEFNDLVEKYGGYPEEEEGEEVEEE